MRASSLPLAEICTESARLGALHPYGSLESLRGDAVHAGAALSEASSPPPRALADAYASALAALSPEMRAEVSEMLATLAEELRRGAIPRGVQREVELAVDLDGLPCSASDPAVALTGHADMAGVDHSDRCGSPEATLTDACAAYRCRAVVWDLKTGQHRDYNLQLIAYALMWAAACGLDRLAWCTLYVRPREAPEYQWSETYEGDTAEQLWRRVRRVLVSPIRAVTGPHCDGCFRRRYCPAHLAPALERAHDALAPFAVPGGLTRENAPLALRVVKAMKDAVELADGQLRTLARETGPIVDGTQEWGPSTVKGRMSADIEAIERDGVQDRYMKMGGSYERWGWKKRKGLNGG